MIYIFIILVFLFLSISIVLIYFEIQNRKLIKTVTSLDRGTRSERRMILKILKLGIKPTAIFHDIYLKIDNDKYSQIDLVVATDVGIIVFEIKEYSGWIFGTENQINWTQILAYGKQKYKFYNPILQNKKHIEDLKKFSLFKDIPIFSIIVFFGDCEFKNNIEIPDQTFFSKSDNVINKFNEILQNHKLVKYRNKWDVVYFFNEAVKNGENYLIRKQHTENIQKILKRNTIN